MRDPRSALSSIVRAARVAPALRRGFGVSLLLALIGTAGQVVVPIAVQQLLDRHILAGGAIELDAVAGYVAVAAVALVVALVATRVAMFRLLAAAAHGLADLRVVAFRHIHDLSVLHVQAERRGALVARVTSDIETVNEFLEWGGVGMIISGAQVLLTVVVMVVYDWRLALLVIVAALVYAALLAGFQRVLGRAYDKVRTHVAEALAAMSEVISGLPTIRAYGAEERTLRRVDRALDDQFRAEFRTGRLGAIMFSSAELFAASVTAAVVVAGVALADAGMTAGTLVAFLFLVALFIEPVQLLVEILDMAQTAGAGVRRVLDVLDQPIEVPDPGAAGVDLPPGPVDVVFAAVRFRYPTRPPVAADDGTGGDLALTDTTALRPGRDGQGGQPADNEPVSDRRAGIADVLRDVDVAIPAGARLAVVGETGSGKSTFAKLLTRLLDPTEGEIRLSGVPLDRVRFASLRRRVAFVPQEGFLFDATVADNVRYGRPEATDEEVRKAFADLDLMDWLDTLPAGLDTRVGERGGWLSAGERQLVALVRAWISAPDLLVLDEATSSVDPALEVRLRRAIERLTAGRTSVTVAHRLSTAEVSDEVLVFDGGRLVERGHHDELVAHGGVYAALHADWSAGTAA